MEKITKSQSNAASDGPLKQAFICLFRLKTHQENNVYGIYHLFLNLNVKISDLGTSS